MKVLITGAAGFIGFHLSQRLISQEMVVHGLDNINDYYDVALKKSRLEILQGEELFTFHKLELADSPAVMQLFAEESFDYVIHLAAQAGVRYSLTNPQAYVDSNITGTLSVLEACRRNGVKHLLFASTSSVYGLNTDMPFSVHKGVNHPLSLYASSKRSGELMGHNYAALFGLPFTAVRFFTVYGPWGRPDMALFLFTKNIIEQRPIDVFNQGDHLRDFTYVDDIVDGIDGLLARPPAANSDWDSDNPDPASSSAPFRIYNIGSSRPIALKKYIETIEQKLGLNAQKNYLPLQPGDVQGTFADVSDLRDDIGYEAKTSIEDGISAFIDWYRSYYNL